MDTAIDKSWLNYNPFNTNNLNGGQSDFIFNSIQGIVDKNKQATTDTRNDIFDLNATEATFSFNENKPYYDVPIVSPPHLILESRSYFTGAQRWIGHVTSIRENVFTADLVDLNDPTTYEIGEFDLSEVPPQDAELLSLGAAFYWSIGLANNNGQVEKKSLIRFQRMIPWSESDYDKAIDNANSLFDKLNWS